MEISSKSGSQNAPELPLDLTLIIIVSFLQREHSKTARKRCEIHVPYSVMSVCHVYSTILYFVELGVMND